MKLDNLGGLERSHTCGEIRVTDAGKEVILMGWVAKNRDLGNFTFVDVRDRDGVTQAVFSESFSAEAHATSQSHLRIFE